ncbi:MAG: Gfo/Idh/MocA family oxidoreductase [Acidimicrobiales bacterium]|nr:Gfo/Idh/MocA family oxidoreductase [Acidimicrobiales bacterium]
MNLHRLAVDAAAAGRPVRVGLIGAGKFGSMFLAQVPYSPVRVTAIADLDIARAQRACRETGWSDAQVAETAFTTSADELLARTDVDVVVEATGNPVVGVEHALACFAAGKHLVAVNVEADALVGPLLAEAAAEAGVVYSLAYGDQPALVCEQVDWARACGFEVVAAGKGTKHHPSYHRSTPDTIWDHYGITAEQAAAAGMNSQMFNSFLDGTKSAIEMCAIANATGLAAPSGGLAFPPCGVDDLPHVLRPRADGGILEAKGMVEVVSCLETDFRPVHRDLRWGVYVVLEAPTPYAAACFAQYGLRTDSTGRYAAMYKPFHLIGLELNLSVLSAALRREPTGRPQSWQADVVAVAKRDLRAGELLDGEGGFTVYGRLMPAADSVALGGLPIGLAHGVELAADIPSGTVLRWADVVLKEERAAHRLRRALEATIAGA